MVLKNVDFKRTLKNKKRYHVCEERYKVSVDTSVIKDYTSIFKPELDSQINVSEGRNGFDFRIVGDYQNVLFGVKDNGNVYIGSCDAQSIAYDNLCDANSVLVPNNYCGNNSIICAKAYTEDTNCRAYLADTCCAEH